MDQFVVVVAAPSFLFFSLLLSLSSSSSSSFFFATLFFVSLTSVVLAVDVMQLFFLNFPLFYLDDDAERNPSVQQWLPRVCGWRR